MEKKEKLKVLCCFFVFGLSTFMLGLSVGEYKYIKSKYKKNKDKYISFYSTKNVGKETNEIEKKTLKTFIIPYEECIRNELNENEKKIIKGIEKEVINMSKNNTKVKFKISDLKSVKNKEEAKKTISKTRKCLKGAYKHMSKTEKKVLRSALSKLSIDNVISIFHGIR